MNKVLIIILTCVLAACSSTNKKDVAIEQASIDSVEIAVEAHQAEKDFDCIRGEPEPSLDSVVFPNSHFQLIDKTTAIEMVVLDNGDRIAVRHEGCEYFVQTYRFESSRFQADITDILFWHKITVKLLSELEQANISPIDIKAGLSALANYMDVNTEINLEEEIEFGESEIRQFVSLDKIEQLDKDRFAIEVIFAIGPL
ncbi:MAG: hypothetical protein NXI09_05605 [Bacteroidetes bacterium]|nr:hypothetical protein [Bacteroidota bacterium]